MPRDPRAASGACTALVSLAGPPVSMVANPAPSLSAWMTGGAGAGTLLNLVQSAQFGAWPPAQIGSPNATNVAFLPTYTQTESISTLTGSTPTSYPTGYSSATPVGNGWNQPLDIAPYYTPVAGCPYPNAWFGVSATIPTTLCTGGGGASGAAVALASLVGTSTSASSSSTTASTTTAITTAAPVAPAVVPSTASFAGLAGITIPVTATKKRRGYETHFLKVPGPTAAPSPL